MSYNPGTFVDLSYLNKKQIRSSTTSAGQFLFDVGTHLKLIATEAGYKYARSIPVVAL